MLYREIIAVCSHIHTKPINALYGQNVELLNVKLVVHIVTAGVLDELCRRVYCLTLKIKAQRSVGTSGTTRPATQPHIPDDLKLPSRHSAFRNVFSYNSSCLHHLPCMHSFSVFAHARLQSHSSFLLTLTQHCCKLISNSCLSIYRLCNAYRLGHLQRLQPREIVGNGELKENEQRCIACQATWRTDLITFKTHINLNYVHPVRTAQ
jgi:hypothetical protein